MHMRGPGRGVQIPAVLEHEVERVYERGSVMGVVFLEGTHEAANKRDQTIRIGGLQEQLL
jgi:hypothetical protein